MDEKRHDTLRMMNQLLKQDYEAGKKKIEKNMPRIKRIFGAIFIGCATAIFLSMLFLVVSIYWKMDVLNVLSGILLAIAIATLLIAFMPIGVLVEFLRGGGWKSFENYLKFIAGFCFWIVLMRLLLAFLPYQNNPKMVFIFILVSTMLSYVLSKYEA